MKLEEKAACVTKDLSRIISTPKRSGSGLTILA